MGFEFTAPVKDPDSILRHAFDWTAWLQDGETIIAQAVTAPVGITVDQVTQADGVVSYRIAGGADGAEYIVTCRVTTSLGRIDDRSVRYRVGQR
jgi:NADPH-dependent curcumin reductase CurA